MRHPAELTSLDNPRVKRVVSLRRHRVRRESGLLVAEGLREVGRAAAAGLTLHELFVCPPRLSQVDLTAAVSLAGERSAVYAVTEPMMKKMAYREHPEGVLAVMDQPRWSLASLGRFADERRAQLRGAGGSVRGAAPGELWLVAVGTEKPGNLGAMARSAEAAGATGLLVADAPVDAFNPNAIRASTGAVFSLPVTGGRGSDLVMWLRGRGVGLYASAPADAGDGQAAAVGAIDVRAYTDVDFTGDVALIIGAEDQGLPDLWLSATRGDGASAGAVITIPMHGQSVDSLNASVAAGVLLFEAARQRRAVA